MRQPTEREKQPRDRSSRGPKRRAAFPYRGGKFHLAPKIIKLFPSHQTYVEVFGGAANVLFCKQPSPIEVYNDRNGALVNLFETIRNHPLLFLERCNFLQYSRELYQDWKKPLQTGTFAPDVDKVEAAVRTLYCLRSSFIGDPTKGWAFSRRPPSHGGSSRWTSTLGQVAILSERLRHVAIDCLDFRECIKNWDSEHTLFFLDPPYVSSMSMGFYGRNFGMEDHGDLVKILKSAKGRWLMTIDDVPQLRELYSGFEMQCVSTKLASQKVSEGGTRKELMQIIVTNYPVGEHVEVSQLRVPGSLHAKIVPSDQGGLRARVIQRDTAGRHCRRFPLPSDSDRRNCRRLEWNDRQSLIPAARSSTWQKPPPQKESIS